MSSPSIRVHLVHGTWAKGLFSKKKAWSEQGHEVYARLQTLLPQGTAIESFAWTGANSVSGREKASRLLRDHLQKSLEAHPADEHVVIAHSHGGTISSTAVADPSLDGRVKSLICLATPFAYLVRASLERLQVGVVALASMGYALYWTALLAFFPWIPAALGPELFIGLVALKSLCAFFFVMFLAGRAHDLTVPSDPRGPQQSKVFLLRGSTDEATLALSTAQVVNWGISFFAMFQEVTKPSVRRPLTLLMYFFSYAVSLALGVLLAIRVQKMTLQGGGPELTLPLGLFVYGPAAVGLIYGAGCLVLGIAAGFWSINRWMTCALEVESAPPDTASQIYVFSQVRSGGMRHSLYEDEAVLKMTATLASS